MTRGDVVTVALQGDYGKPRPALVVQANAFNDTHASITVLPITSELLATPLFRITLDPLPANGLRAVSQVMVDKIISIRRERIGRQIGRVDDDTMVRVGRAMAVWLGIA
ncbi:type II toxin-antitoxin system PemK/MazF family toxin [Vineibacter terrae]|uniref:Type II toxin-antitoxin system PemK/MazF family toxin n=1 Tax=Vineibacter terrae TaxID=2586908 RepID=A0A5C8P844_9HYPH|nr:type II toxin-antitoxin system PemK/MazF family toxin [Vineibacter terrae]TXL69695.1 type II toxin-antitoxin system PemK/MazF family toxin [Vineibacter terrae]HEX2889875.1 type II toxin-antitoxin system PemK/MazF family toxin [Vineibacter terrae]